MAVFKFPDYSLYGEPEESPGVINVPPITSREVFPDRPLTDADLLLMRELGIPTSPASPFSPLPILPPAPAPTTTSVPAPSVPPIQPKTTPTPRQRQAAPVAPAPRTSPTIVPPATVPTEYVPGTPVTPEELSQRMSEMGLPFPASVPPEYMVPAYPEPEFPTQAEREAAAPPTLPTWEPLRPVDWASEYQRLYESTFPPGQTWQPYTPQKPDIWQVLALMGARAAGYDPIKLWQQREAQRRLDWEKGQAATQQERINRFNALSKAMDLRREAENRAISDRLHFLQTLVDAHQQIINDPPVLAEIARLRGIAPEDVKHLYDPKTKKYKIAVDPTQVELDKMKTKADFLRDLAPKLGLTTPEDMEIFAWTGQIPSHAIEPEYFFKKKITDALKKNNVAEAAEWQRQLGQYNVFTQGRHWEEEYKKQETINNIAELRKKLPSSQWNRIAPYLYTFAATQHFPAYGMFGEREAEETAKTAAKEKEATKIIREAKESLIDPKKYEEFTNTYGLSPDNVLYSETKRVVHAGGLPPDIVGLGVDQMGSTANQKQEILNQINTEQSIKLKSPKAQTPTIDQALRLGVASARKLYGNYIARVDESLRRKNMPPLTDEEIVGFYNLTQTKGLPSIEAFVNVVIQHRKMGTSPATKK